MGCDCNIGLGNSGVPGCVNISVVARKLILVPLYDNTGVRNSIAFADVLDQTYFDEKVNETADKRWFPLVVMENITNEKADSLVEESAGGTKAFLKEGVRSFFGEMWEVPPQLVGKLKKARCVDLGVYVVDYEGRIIGMESEDGTLLYPIKIDKQSVDPKYVYATDSATSKVTLGFDFAQSEKDENIQVIEPSEYSGDVLGLNGLLDIYGTFSGLSTTGGTVKLYTDFGTFKDPLLDSGLILADVDAHNITDDAAITLLTWTSNANGTFTYTYAAQTVADEISLRPSKTGRDYTPTAENTYVTP